MGRCRTVVFALVCAAVWSGVVVSAASAQEGFQPAGAVTGHFLVAKESIGGGILADVHIPVSVLRIGVGLGAVAISSDDADRARTFMPVTASFGLVLGGDSFAVNLRARGGLWAGAINSGLAAGGFVGGGGYLAFGLGAGAYLTAGCDVWGVIGHGSALVIAPGLGLLWTPGAGDDTEEIPNPDGGSEFDPNPVVPDDGSALVEPDPAVDGAIPPPPPDPEAGIE